MFGLERFFGLQRVQFRGVTLYLVFSGLSKLFSLEVLDLSYNQIGAVSWLICTPVNESGYIVVTQLVGRLDRNFFLQIIMV